MRTKNQISLTRKTLLCRNTVIKMFSVIVILSLLLMSIGTPARAAQVQDPKSVTTDNDKTPSYEPCIISDGMDRLTVDNSIGGGAGQGCLIDYSQFPVARVRVENLHGFWTKIALFDNYNDVSVVPENVWAEFGYIAPDAYAEYTLTFDSSYNSRVMFFVNAAQSEDSRPSAGLLNIISKLKTLENFFWPFFAPIYRGFTKLTRTYGGVNGCSRFFQSFQF